MAPAACRIPQLCSVNGALEIDLLGRVNAEMVDGQRISGPGGQADFAAGATASPGGKSIIALRATSKDGSKTRIVPTLAAGAPVTIDTRLVALRRDRIRRSARGRPVRLGAGAGAGRYRSPAFRADLLSS